MLKLVPLFLLLSLVSSETLINSDENFEFHIEESSCNSSDSTLLLHLLQSLRNANYQNIDTFIDIFCNLSTTHLDFNDLKIRLNNQVLEQGINNTLDLINGKIVSDMRNLAENSLRNYFDQLRNISESHTTSKHSDTLLRKEAETCNLLTTTTNELLETKNPKEFVLKLVKLFKNFNILKDLDNSYLLKRFSEIRFLFSMFHERVYRSAASGWAQPFREFKIRIPQNSSDNCYHEVKNDTLTEDNFMSYCENITSSNPLTSFEARFVIRGNNVKLSDIDLKKCEQKVRLIEIFALDTVIIDTNLNLSGKAVEVAIVAPTWIVVGEKSIYLNGKNGGRLRNPQATNGSDGEIRNGNHGLAGLPGGPAGKFYGISSSIINARNLKINALGGNGGPGQNGGNGAGEFGRGGNGGAGGLGGKEGIVDIAELVVVENHESPVASSADGKVGAGGDGGYPGEWGQTAKDLCNNEMSPSLYNSTEATFQKDGSKNCCFWGKKGASLKMRRMPDYLDIQQNYRSIISRYKSYAVPHLKNLCSCEKSVLIKFYNSLSIHPKEDKLYNTLSFIEEFKELELKYFKFREEENFTSSYVDLEKRIGDYLERTNMQDEDTNKYAYILKDLQFDLLDRINIFHSKTYPVSTNVRSAFYALITKPIHRMREGKKIIKVLTWLQDFKLSLDDNIKDAQYMISGVQKAINDFETTLNQEMATLLDEIEILKGDYQNQAILTEVRQELQNVIEQKTISEVFRVVLGVLHLINPALHLAGSIILSARSIIGLSTLEPNAGTKIEKIPRPVQKTILKTKNFFLIEKRRQQKVFEQQKTFLQHMKTSKSGKNVINKVWKSTKHIRDLDPQEIYIRNRAFALQAEYGKQEEQLRQWVKEAQTSMKPEAIENFKAGIEAVKYLKTTSYVFQSVPGVVADITKDKGKIDEVNIAMKAVEESLKNIHHYEKNVYNEVEPMLCNMMRFLGLTTRNESNINETDIFFDEWNVRDNLKKIKIFLSDMIEYYNRTDNVIWILDKLNSIFDTSSEIYTKLFKCRKEKWEHKFNYNLHIAHNSHLLINDSSLKRALARLQEVVSYNDLLEAYDRFMAVFKQYTFPHAGFFLVKWKEISVQKGVDYVMETIKTNSGRLSNFLNQAYWTIILIEKRMIAPFWGSDSETKSAFFIWKHEKYSREIGNILRGNETTLVANINEAMTVNCLKFNRVEVIFTTANLTIRNKLHEALEAFEIILTHHGDSKYRFFNNIYEIQNTPTTIEYSLLKDSEGFPIYQSRMYKHIMNGDFMLSPFATWTIKLESADSSLFQILEEFINEVDLELVGSGEFLHAFSDIDVDDIDKYYTKVESIGSN